MRPSVVPMLALTPAMPLQFTSTKRTVMLDDDVPLAGKVFGDAVR